VISRKAILAGLFSAVVGIGMLAMPVRAMAHGWDHDGDGARHEHHDNGNHNGWYNHRGDEGRYQHRGYYAPNQSYRYGYNHEPDADDYGYGNGYYGNGYGYGNRYGYGNGYGYPSNGQGMVNPRHPGLIWACDSDGHHCHWASRTAYNYGQTGLNPFGSYYGNNGYGYNGYGNGYGNGYSPLGGLGSLLGIPMP